MKEQLFLLFSCLTFGAVCGFCYQFFSLFGRLAKGKIAAAILDGVFFFLSGGGFLLFSVANGLGEFRPSMLAFSLLGALLYEKSMGKTLAFFVEGVYNKTNKVRLKRYRGGKPCKTKNK